VALPRIFLGDVFGFDPGAEMARAEILVAGCLVAVFLLRIRAL